MDIPNTTQPALRGPSFPNAVDRIGQRIHVAQNHPQASDANPGTAEKPFKTITAAVENLESHDQVHIGHGIYRETVPLRAHGHLMAPKAHVHFMAYEGEEVRITGSDLFPGPWTPAGDNIFQATLPAFLFEDGVYNPYALRCAIGEHEVVRPCPEGDDLPLTLGQIYVNGQAFRQANGPDTLRAHPGMFLVPADGKSILVNFGDLPPDQQVVELTVRRRCFEPQFEGPVMIQTHNICVDHAAEPGPFCKDRPLGIRRNPNGVVVVKECILPGPVGNGAKMITSPGYLSRSDNTLIAGIVDDTLPVRSREVEYVNGSSTDGGRTWKLDESTRCRKADREAPDFFLDERTDTLMKFWREHPHGSDPDGAFGVVPHDVLFAWSRDGGASWSPPSVIDRKKKYFFTPCSLADGHYIWPYIQQVVDNRHHHDFGVLIGRWEGNDVVWEPGGRLHVEPHESAMGLAEPSVVQFADGRLIAFFRAGSTAPSQEHAGVPAVKLFSLSDDGGHSWTLPQPLCYEDGNYVYSPRAYHLAMRSRKNGRVYLALNISDGPCFGCDPRTHLYLAEVDPGTLRVPRERLILVEAKHPEHHRLVRYSNFRMIEDRITGNPVIFMKLGMSEFCPVLYGYDQSCYRYEICLS